MKESGDLSAGLFFVRKNNFSAEGFGQDNMPFLSMQQNDWNDGREIKNHDFA